MSSKQGDRSLVKDTPEFLSARGLEFPPVSLTESTTRRAGDRPPGSIRLTGESGDNGIIEVRVRIPLHPQSGGLAHLVEHFYGIEKVRGSNPLSSTRHGGIHGPITRPCTP